LRVPAAGMFCWTGLSAALAARPSFCYTATGPAPGGARPLA